MLKNLSLSFIELSKKNLVHNIKQFRSLAKKGTKISVAIKGNAYGHGESAIAKILDPQVDYFQIDSIEELELLRKVSAKKTFLMGYVQKSELQKAVKLRCVISVLSLAQLKELNKTAGKLKIKQEIQVSVDAHLGREGFLFSELREVFTEIKNYSAVKLVGIYAHFANIEDTSSFTHAQKQIDEYKKALDLAKEFYFEGLDTHISATSGLLVYEKKLGLNPILRLGVGVYGMWPSEDIQKMYKNKITLKPVLSWKTKVAQVKTLPKGHTIGYGLTYITKKETKIAIIPQGYADGFDRGLSNIGEVLIGSTRCRVLGRISMNMFAVDVSHLPQVKVEDEVVILGTQGEEEITAEQLAKLIDTINYEITTRVSPLLPRVIV